MLRDHVRFPERSSGHPDFPSAESEHPVLPQAGLQQFARARRGAARETQRAATTSGKRARHARPGKICAGHAMQGGLRPRSTRWYTVLGGCRVDSRGEPGQAPMPVPLLASRCCPGSPLPQRAVGTVPDRRPTRAHALDSTAAAAGTCSPPRRAAITGAATTRGGCSGPPATADMNR